MKIDINTEVHSQGSEAWRRLGIVMHQEHEPTTAVHIETVTPVGAPRSSGLCEKLYRVLAIPSG